MGDLQPLADRAIDDLKLSPEVTAILKNIQANLAEGYREGFLRLAENMNTVISSLSRIQETLKVLVEHVAPTLKDKVPVGFQLARPGEKPDLATALVVADPIGMGYMLSQQDLADALKLAAPEVSVLVRAFGLKDDGECAVVVRRGKSKEIVNYNKTAIEKFTRMVASPPPTLTASQMRVLDRVRRKLVINAASSSAGTTRAAQQS